MRGDDPESRQLDGWRLVAGRYEPLVPNDRGWLWSDELGLWLGTWEGEIAPGVRDVWLRFYDDQGRLVPTAAEAERQRAEAAEAEVLRLKALLGLTPGTNAD